MQNVNRVLFASVISEIQQSDIFMTAKARICEAPAANLNGARVTEAFIDEIVGNEERYVGLPLYADVKALTSGNYRRLGHLYDARTGEFHSTQIGSFYQFEKEELEEGCALIGYARIPKRNKKLHKAICELFADGALKFSFEVAVGEYEELEDDTILIDASENNYLEGTAIVTFPACEDAVALQLVAQKADDTEGGETEMAETNENVIVDTITEEVAEQTEPQEEVAETIQPEVEEEVAETTEEVAAEETGEEQPESEIAAVCVREQHFECDETSAYDTETGTEVTQRVTVETVVHTVEDGEIVNVEEEVAEEEVAEEEIAEEEVAEETPETEVQDGNSGKSGETDEPAQTKSNPGSDAKTSSTEEIPVTDNSDSKKTAEQLIAELAEVVESLRNEVAELKEQKQIAETKTITAEINPFTDSINAEKQFTLLEKDTPNSDFSLLSK